MAYPDALLDLFFMFHRSENDWKAGRAMPAAPPEMLARIAKAARKQLGKGDWKQMSAAMGVKR